MTALAISDFTLEPEGGRLRLMDIGHGADLYLGELARMGRTPRTRETYRRTLYELDERYPRHDVDTVTASMLREFLDIYQINRRRDGGKQPNSKATLAQRITHVCCFFKWLHEEELIRHNPAARLKRPKLAPAYENDNVVTISSEDGRLLLVEANRSAWPERIAVNMAVYTGARRHALAQARRGDYDMVDRTLRFREKGGKTIVKPVAEPLAAVLDAAIIAGVYETDDDYLIPGRAEQRREGQRDDRIISKLVKTVADEAGVKTTVHALRAAFATRYLEQNGETHLLSLQDLMGHSRSETTMTYLRRLDRRRNMETVRGLDWGVASSESFEAFAGTEKEGFEPSLHAESTPEPDGIPSEAAGHEGGGR